MSKIVCVVPSIRPERMEEFKRAWQPHFEHHKVTLITVWDGENPTVEVEDDIGTNKASIDWSDYESVVCRRTDAVRNLGFLHAAQSSYDYILTLDDDVAPVLPFGSRCEPQNADDVIERLAVRQASLLADPIQAHLDVLQKRVPLSWMNTAHCNSPYLRGVPYNIRDEAPVMLSHGVWMGVPDFDGETQLALEKKKLPDMLPYYVGPIPKCVHFPLCGMNVMVRREALPYFYFAPMGPDSGVEGLHRFGDIWMGLHLKQAFDAKGWACYTGYSIIRHTRASDATKNFEQERLGREWNECTLLEWSEGKIGTLEMSRYFKDYAEKRERFYQLITEALNASQTP